MEVERRWKKLKDVERSWKKLKEAERNWKKLKEVERSWKQGDVVVMADHGGYLHHRLVEDLPKPGLPWAHQ